MNILLVEDAVVVRTYLEKYLRELGHEVTSCADAETALHTYQQTFYPLIILDLGLPGMDGFEFCRRIQTLPHRERSMILVITIDDDLKTLQKALDVRVDDYLVKPVKIDQLHIRLMIIERQWQNLIERKEMEKALRESEEKYRALFESLQDVFYRTDTKGNLLLVSPSIFQLLGYTQEEASRLNIRKDIVASPEQWQEFVTSLRKNGYLKEFELLLKHCSGRIVWGSASAQWYRDKNGRMLGMEGMIRGVTERKQAEETLLQLRKAVETMQLGVTITTPEGHILYTNPADAAMHGYSPEELIDQEVRIFAPAELRDPMSLAQIKNLKGWVRESLNIRKDGSCFPVLLRSDIVKDADGKTFAIVTTCEDITKRKQAEEELRQAHEELEQRVKERTAELLAANEMLQREIAKHKRTAEELQQAKELAESANRAKSVFLANMSHELRTPLNAILGYAQILKNVKNLNERQMESIDIVKRSGEHLLSMINDILDLSKIEAGRIELQISELHLPEFLKSIADMIRIQAEQKGLVFLYEGDLDLPVGVRTDEKRLREILINLLSNAVKFTEKGSVTFRVKRVDELDELDEFNELKELGVSKTQKLKNSKTQKLLFEVKDTGIGIAPEHLEEIFLPFRQVGEQYAIEGTGLGLAISQQLVKAMGGELSVQSTVGKGSLFWFEVDFPEIPGFIPKSPPHGHNIQGYRGERRTVLITDDKLENRLMLVDMLLPLGFHILEAENGQECLEKTLQHRPDVILLDIRMPIMDGFEVTRQIRTLDEIHNITIIAVTASVFEERRKHILEAGCDAYLAKPFEVEDLLHMLQSYLHLEWVYTEDIGESMDMNTPEDFQPGQFAELPSEHINNLIAFAERGSLTKILTELDTIEHLNAEYAPVVHQLRRLTKRFRFDDIITFLKQDTHCLTTTFRDRGKK